MRVNHPGFLLLCLHVIFLYFKMKCGMWDKQQCKVSQVVNGCLKTLIIGSKTPISAFCETGQRDGCCDETGHTSSASGTSLH
jgi:hypothetical protein